MSDRIRLEFLGQGRPAEAFDPPADGRVIVLGRPSAEQRPGVPLADPGVSRRHAELSFADGAWTIVSAGKTGTLVDGELVAAGQRRLLEHGSVLQIGPFGMRVDLGKAGRSGAFETLGFTDAAAGARAMQVPRAELERLAELRLSSLIAASARINAAADEQGVLEAVAAILCESRDFERAAVIGLAGTDDDAGWKPLAVAPPEAVARGGAFSRTLLAAARDARAMVQLEDDLRFRAAESMIGTSAAICTPLVTGPGAPRLFVYADCRAGVRPAAAAIPFANLVAQLAGAAIGTAEQRKLVGDLEQARLIQKRLMPEEEGVRGHVRWVRFSRAADTRVSGDFFAVVDAADGRVAAALGDVAGKGAGAGLVMAAAVTHLDTSVRMGLAVEEAVTAVSDFFARRPSFEVATAGFITAIAVEVHPDGRCRGVDAGHAYAAIVRADGRAERLVFPSNMTMVGLFEGIRYEADGFELAPGDRIVLFSDGVVEQPGPTGDRLCPNFADDASPVVSALEGSRSAADDVSRLRELLARHAAGLPWEDDVTIASIEYRP